MTIASITRNALVIGPLRRIISLPNSSIVYSRISSLHSAAPLTTNKPTSHDTRRILPSLQKTSSSSSSYSTTPHCHLPYVIWPRNSSKFLGTQSNTRLLRFRGGDLVVASSHCRAFLYSQLAYMVHSFRVLFPNKTFVIETLTHAGMFLFVSFCHLFDHKSSVFFT